MEKRVQEIFYDLKNLHGKIPYTYLNDFMFKYALQESPLVLTALISSLLHIPVNEIEKPIITNPILLGDDISDKKFELDVLVNLTNGHLINLEMQVSNENNWTNRSLSYLCRTFDSLEKGEDYNNVNPVTHIGFLNYDLFPDYPEFYAKHKLINERFGYIFNSNFELNVVSLNQIDLATDEDKAWGTDTWAKLFKATTWEDMKMIAENDLAKLTAINTLKLCNSDFRAKEAARKYEDRVRHQKYLEKQLAEKDNEIAKMSSTIVLKDNELSDKDNEIAKLKQEIEQLKSGK